MPKIPMLHTPGQIEHRRATVPMSGAPGMDWGHEESRTLEKFGDRIIDSGDRLYDSATRLLSIRKEYEKKREYTENNLAKTDAGNLYIESENSLQSRMRENPDQYEHFHDWELDMIRQYREQVREYTGKMSADFRKQFEAEMDGVYLRHNKEREAIYRSARETSGKNRLRAQFDDAIKRMDANACQSLIQAHKGILLSESEAELWSMTADRLIEKNEVRGMLGKTGLGEIRSYLEARDESGNYLYYPKLHESDRKELIRDAKLYDAEYCKAKVTDLFERLHNGEEEITVDMIEKEFEGRTGTEDLNLKHEMIRMVKKFKSARESALANLNKANAEREQQKYDDGINKKSYELLTYSWSSDPKERQEQYDKELTSLASTYVSDGKAYKKLKSDLDESYNAIAKPDESYKNSFIYGYMMRELKRKKESFFSIKPEEERPSGWNIFGSEYNDDEEILKNNYRMAIKEMDEWIRVNPTATESEVDTQISALIRAVNETSYKKLANFWNTRKSLPVKKHVVQPVKEELKAGDIMNGYRYLGGDPKDPNNWKKVE